MADLRELVVGDSSRESADISVLLEDLDRLFGTLADLPPRAPERTHLLQRAFLLWQLELERGGNIEINCVEEGFASEPHGTITADRLDRLVKKMNVHAVTRIVVSPELAADSFTRFVSLLALPTSHLDDMCEGKFAGRLYANSGPGIEINHVSRSGPNAAAPVASEAQSPSTQTFAPKTAWPNLEEDPFEAPAMAMDGEKLRLALRELDRCDNDVLYDTLIDRALERAQSLWVEGHREESYRALLVLSDHVANDDEAMRGRQVRAKVALEEFADREHMDFLIERACACEAGGVRPTQILLQIGDQAAPAVLDALDAESDPQRSTQLAGMLLALGDCAVPVLAQTIARRSGSRLQLAVRLAGELQNPKLVPALASVLLDSGPALRREAGMALVNVGNTEACDVLIKALANDNPELARTAALCLGVLGENHATKPLLAALNRAIDEQSYPVATSVIKALGQLDIAPPDIVAVISPLFETTSGDTARRSDPADLRGAKCAALTIAANFDSTQARDLLMAATRDSDENVGQKAHDILNQQDLRQTP